LNNRSSPRDCQGWYGVVSEGEYLGAGGGRRSASHVSSQERFRFITRLGCSRFGNCLPLEARKPQSKTISLWPSYIPAFTDSGVCFLIWIPGPGFRYHSSRWKCTKLEPCYRFRHPPSVTPPRMHGWGTTLVMSGVRSSIRE